MMSEAATGVDAEMRPLTLAIQGFSKKGVEPNGMLPNEIMVVLKKILKKRERWVGGWGRERKKPQKIQLFFLGSLIRDRHFLHVLNWPCHAVSSTGLPGADCFHIGQCSVPVLVSRKIRVCFLWH